MLEAGTLELGVGTFEIRHLVAGLALATPAHPRSSGVPIETEFADEIPEAVCGDGHRIRHVLTKLVASALGYSNDDQLMLRVSATSHSAKRMMLRFEVIHRGGDVTGESLESLFDLYAYAQGSTTQDDRTTGIGLTVCKQLVELMGGDIGVQQTPGEETTFWFTTPVGIDGTVPYPQDRVRATPRPARAPVAPHAAPPRPRETPTQGTAGGPRLLIADDDPVSRLVLTRQLEARGYLVDVATNGREALDLHASGTYAAIFMDCQMPGVDGFEATRQIRNGEEGVRVPIIAMTAFSLPGDRERCLAAGMDDYLSKPIQREQAEAVIARWLPTDRSSTSALAGAAEATEALRHELV
jgi:CheY-like chemotaxis protein